MFSLRNKEKLFLNYPQYLLLSGALNWAQIGKEKVKTTHNVKQDKQEATLPFSFLPFF